MDPSAAIQIIILILLLALSALFSSAETALTTVNKIRIRSLLDDEDCSQKKKKRAKLLLATVDDSPKMLSAILIGNNIVNLSASALTTSLAYRFGGYMVGLATGILTLLILLFGEITPKTMATLHSESMSMTYAPIIYVFMKVMTPIIFIINKLSLGILLLCHVDPNGQDGSMTEGELRTIVDVSHEDGVIESEEKEMIYNVFDMGDAKAKDIMVPRVHVTSVDIDTSYEDLIAIFKEDKYTRFPVYEETSDHIVGTINMKDLLLYETKEDFHIRDILREAHFIYEYKNIAELLAEMKKDSINIVIVLDEYGEPTGILTLEDILEEIVGEIHDEFDETEEDPVQKINDTEYLVEGSMNLEDCCDELDIRLESEDYDSLGGYIIEQLDRLPKLYDNVVTSDGIRLVVDKLDKNRIETVHVYLPVKKKDPEILPEDA